MRLLKVRTKQYGYGGFPGGDPRLFSPDSEGQTTEEAEAHKAACEAWDAGAKESEPDGTCIPGFGFVDRCQFGLGSYEWTEDLWIWEWLRYEWLPHVKSRLWWWWNT